MHTNTPSRRRSRRSRPRTSPPICAVHVPPQLPHLAGVWQRAPFLFNGRCCYVGNTNIFWFNHMWVVAYDGMMLAGAISEAQHPHTVAPGEWHAQVASDVWLRLTAYRICAPLTSSPQAPLHLDDIGLDFFVRLRITRPVWFVDPMTGRTRHSGAKCRDKLAKGASKRPKRNGGVRFCPTCFGCFSANNFVTQHMRNVHGWRSDPRFDVEADQDAADDGRNE